MVSDEEMKKKMALRQRKTPEHCREHMTDSWKQGVISKSSVRTSERSKVMSPRATQFNNRTLKKLMDVFPQKFQQELKVTHELFFHLFLGVVFIQ